MRTHRRLLAAALCLVATGTLADAQPSTTTAAPTSQPIAVRVDVDLAQTIGPWKPVQRFFGADEPNYAYMPGGRRLLRELGKLGTPEAPVYFRTHNLMTTGDGTPALKWGSTNLYAEDAAGNPVYDFAIVDRIFDTYLAAGVKPYVQLGFMPQAMSTRPQPYRHHWTPTAKYDEIYTGWTYPPKDYKKWEELCYVWAKHCVERYGRAEVESWYWETWNEPNIGYWRGTPEEFNQLHDHAIAGVKRALPTAKVGGPDTAGDGGKFMEGFLKHVLDGKNHATGSEESPFDFVSFHAKGAPIVAKEGFQRMGINAQLKTLDVAFARFAKDERTKNLPIVIGEFDPEGCAACQGANLAYRNGTMYASYTAISFARAIELADKHGVNLEGLLTWAFTFEGYAPFAGFRALSSGEIDHPVLNTFRLFAQLEGERVRATSDHAAALDEVVRNGVRGRPEVGALATRTADGARVLLWNYHDDDVPGPAATITLALANLPSDARAIEVDEQRIDATHANAFTAWKDLGSPAEPNAEQLRTLRAAGALNVIREQTLQLGDPITVTLPRQGVSLIRLRWTPEAGR